MRKIGKTKIVFFALITGIVLYSIWNWSLMSYLAEQGYGQVAILFNTKPVKEIMADTNYPREIKDKIQFIQDIKKFAEDSIGLKRTKNYQTFYDQKGKPILWVVKASPKYELKAYQWKFPLAGAFSYKGYFDKDKAIKEQERLIARNYDTRIGQVSGWSTLGILKDPILSNFTRREEGKLANLIIHELTHATIFIKNDISFNENLASFVGDVGAKHFLKTEYGIHSQEYQRYVGSLEDNMLFQKHIMRGAKQLDSLYQVFYNDLSDTIKEQKKWDLIAEIVKNADTIPFTFPDDWRFLKTGRFKPNNAYFTGFLTYHSEQDTLYKFFENNYENNLKKFVEDMKKKYD